VTTVITQEFLPVYRQFGPTGNQGAITLTYPLFFVKEISQLSAKKELVSGLIHS